MPEAVDMDGLQQARTIFVLFFFMIWNFVLSVRRGAGSSGGMVTRQQGPAFINRHLSLTFAHLYGPEPDLTFYSCPWQNIFVGLIASAFEAIRDDQNTITTDRLSRCLVCSIEM